ncbi:MAG: hypothetical protein K6G65_05430 [Lachnospiraceae bacterium]|nr:hypothetical protein [Lachnospiraceae bacterium]
MPIRKNKASDTFKFEQVLQGKEIPILTLDDRWHRMFVGMNKTPEIKSLEKKLNDLVKYQGKMVNDVKDLKALKSRLMNEILQNMSAVPGREDTLRQRKQEKSQKLIYDINDKLREAELAIAKVPDDINQVNCQLLAASLVLWYEKANENSRKLEEVDRWIESFKNQLRDKLLEKQDMEDKNREIYTYMNALLGKAAVDRLDQMTGSNLRKDKKSK